MNPDQRLSPAARQRMQAMLPTLLGAVRFRRRRRHVARAVVAVAMVALGLWCWRLGGAGQSGGQSGGQVGPGPARHEICRIVGDVPDVLDRYRVATVERPEWFVDDDGLQRFLGFDARPAGIVRVGRRVLVASAALDPFPTAPPSLE